MDSMWNEDVITFWEKQFFKMTKEYANYSAENESFVNGGIDFIVVKGFRYSSQW